MKNTYSSVGSHVMCVTVSSGRPVLLIQRVSDSGDRSYYLVCGNARLDITEADADGLLKAFLFARMDRGSCLQMAAS